MLLLANALGRHCRLQVVPSLASAERLSTRAEKENVETALKMERVTRWTVNNDVLSDGDNVDGRNANDTLRSAIAS